MLFTKKRQGDCAPLFAIEQAEHEVELGRTILDLDVHTPPSRVYPPAYTYGIYREMRLAKLVLKHAFCQPSTEQRAHPDQLGRVRLD